MAERPATHSAGKGPIVFQSYSRADKAQAVRLASALQGAGRDVWWDASIEGGAEFAKTIEAAINTCDAVVVAWLKGLHLWFFSEFGNSVAVLPFEKRRRRSGTGLPCRKPDRGSARDTGPQRRAAGHGAGDVVRVTADLIDGRALYQQAQVLAPMGDRESAITALEQARAVGDGGLINARNDPMLDPLRSEPRFARLLQGMGFDEGIA